MTETETETEALAGSGIDDLVELTRAAASAYIGSEMRRYYELVRHTDRFTLMSPFGGDVAREPAGPITPEREAELEAYFRGGECELEVVETYVSAAGDLAVLAVVERQHGDVGPLPPQDWSLRVTLVFRRDGSDGGWRLEHRHADPLVHPITIERLAELARG